MWNKHRLPKPVKEEIELTESVSSSSKEPIRAYELDPTKIVLKYWSYPKDAWGGKNS